jgi:hypothetical protein
MSIEKSSEGTAKYNKVFIRGGKNILLSQETL